MGRRSRQSSGATAPRLRRGDVQPAGQGGGVPAHDDQRSPTEKIANMSTQHDTFYRLLQAVQARRRPRQPATLRIALCAHLTTASRHCARASWSARRQAIASLALTSRVAGHRRHARDARRGISGELVPDPVMGFGCNLSVLPDYAYTGHAGVLAASHDEQQRGVEPGVMQKTASTIPATARITSSKKLTTRTSARAGKIIRPGGWPVSPRCAGRSCSGAAASGRSGLLRVVRCASDDDGVDHFRIPVGDGSTSTGRNVVLPALQSRSVEWLAMRMCGDRVDATARGRSDHERTRGWPL